MPRLAAQSDVQEPGREAPRPRGFAHIRELDGIRGIAAVMVFFHHAAFADLHDKAWQGPGRWLVKASAYGATGVDLFFVLSGFLITSLLLRDRTSDRYYQDFYWKRALRVLPLYFLCLVVTLIVSHNVRYVLLSLFFAANFAIVFHVASSGVFWTLAIEEQFYLLWPTIVRRRSTDEIASWALVVAVACFTLRFVFAWFSHFDYQLSFLRCDGLAFGAILACRLYHSTGAALERRRNRLLLTGLLIAGILAQTISAYIPIDVSSREMAFSGAFGQTGVVLITGSLIGLTILHSGDRALGVLRSRVLTFFGLISYAFYMFHGFVLNFYDRHWGPILPDQVHALGLEIVCAGTATVGLCLLSRYLIELPAMSLRKYVLSHPSPTAEKENPPLPLANM